jgi:YidC/Oxa1 family membrane protein insertase
VGFGVEWIGVTNRYFLTALIPQGELKPKALIQPISAEKGRVSLVYPVTESTIRIPLKGFFGPKELNILKSVDRRLDPALDLGFFTWFAYPLLKLLKFFEGWTANWGVAIILLTLLVKILTYPLTYKSMKSMKKMAALQPKLQKLREKYADDKEALNREMLVLMKEGGYNPAAGCLPILIQMPVFFALYRVLYSSIELYQAPFFLWITDLSTKDPFYITPVVLTAVMYVQQKLTPNTATDPVQAKMMQFMPVMFGVFMVSLPSGLTLYMLVNALASIAQQIILNKKLGTTGASVTQARA